MNTEVVGSLDNIEDYGVEFITQIIGVLLTDREFIELVGVDINLQDYENETHKWIIKEVQKYYEEYRTAPSKAYLRVALNEFTTNANNPKIGKTFRDLTGKLIKDAYDAVDEGIDPAFPKKFSEFCKHKAIERACLTIYSLSEAKDYGSVIKIMQDALKVGERHVIGHSYENDVESRLNEQVTSAIPFPFKEWNERTQGGMHIGDLILLLAPKGAGKSWLSAVIAAYAKNYGYNIQYYTLELDEKVVANRVDAHYLGVPIKAIPNYRDNLRHIVSEKAGKLTITRLKGKQKTLSYIKQHVKMLTNEGKKPHLVIIDYIDILKTSNTDPQAGTKELYEDVRDWASEEGFPVVSPAQIGRAGIKVAVIEGDMVAGYIEKLQVADQVYIIGRPREHKKAGTCVIVTDKNRYGEDGIAELFGFNAAWGEFDHRGEYSEDEEVEAPRQKKETKQMAKVLNTHMENVKSLRQLPAAVA